MMVPRKLKYPDLHRRMSNFDDKQAIEDCLPDIDKLLIADPNDREALFMLGQYFVRIESFALAYTIFNRLKYLSVADSAIESNIAMCLVCLGREKEAEPFLKSAIKLDPTNRGAMANMAVLAIGQCAFARAVSICDSALRIQDDIEIKVSRGFAHLGLGHWERGWQDYSHALKTVHRASIDYGLPQWTGEPGTVIIHGEQGLGDEIMYSRYINDVIARGNGVIVDCDKRLKGIFARSFIKAKVHGDRRAEHRPWLADSGAQWQTAIGELPRILGKFEPERLGGYLQPNGKYSAMYKTLIACEDGAKHAGITWSGGSKGTGRDKRTLDDDALRMLIELVRAHGYTPISLEYDPEQAQRGIDLGVVHHHFATGKGANYEHTAAFIGAMDLVIGTDTTAHHMAGAMGVRSVMLVHDKPLWINSAIHGDAHPWYRSVSYARKKPSETWAETIRRMGDINA